MGEMLRKRLMSSRFESPLHEAVLNLLVAAGHVRDRMERVCTDHGITGGQFNVLRILRGAQPQGYARCDIAKRLIERAPDVTRLIDRLARQGLVERTTSERDQMLSVTRITRKGLRVLDEMEPSVDETFRGLSALLTPRDAKQLSRICERLFGPGG